VELRGRRGGQLAAFRESLRAHTLRSRPGRCPRRTRPSSRGSGASSWRGQSACREGGGGGGAGGGCGRARHLCSVPHAGTTSACPSGSTCRPCAQRAATGSNAQFHAVRGRRTTRCGARPSGDPHALSDPPPLRSSSRAGGPRSATSCAAARRPGRPRALRSLARL